jgi:hypothetical protein
MQLVLPDERPGVFVKRDAVDTVQDCGVVKRLVSRTGRRSMSDMTGRAATSTTNERRGHANDAFAG